jgi:threonine/homoserine/homoserine lactone efflux protein
MMEPELFLKGMIIGLAIAAPVGPIGLLCIKRTLNEGRAVGLASGLGAAVADAIYGSIAAFGLTFVSNFLVSHENALRLIGGGFLCYLGVRTLMSSPPAEVNGDNRSSLPHAFASTFLLTITNPITILSFAAIYSAAGLHASEGHYFAAATLVSGVFCGSSTWWVVLCAGIGLVKPCVESSTLKWVNRISGACIACLGILAVVTIFL